MNDGARDDVRAAVLARLDRALPPGVPVLVDALRARFGPALAAVLVYGSNLRRADDREGLVDLYALVDGYRAAYRRVLPALAARALPPNVHYLECPHPHGGVVRAKVAVVSVADFARRVRPGVLESYFWGRFCQPSALAFARDGAVRVAVAEAIAHAITAALGAAVPLVPVSGTLRELWVSLLDACYRAELRPERAGVGARLVAADPRWFAELGAMLAARVPGLTVHPATAQRGADGANGPDAAVPAGEWDPASPWRALRYTVQHPPHGPRARAPWPARRAWGRTRNVARLLKAAFTFDGGVDYVLWKLERHTGTPVPRTALLRRAPWLGIWPAAWRAWRRGRPGGAA